MRTWLNKLCPILVPPPPPRANAFIHWPSEYCLHCDVVPLPPTGQQVVEEMLDAQRAGCIPEYEDMLVPKCHPLYDADCRGERLIPFLRNRYDFGTGYAPNNPRMQLNEITPWLDGGLMYGVAKAWTDTLRSFEGGRLGSQHIFEAQRAANPVPPISYSVPRDNNIGLPMANPPPPANQSLHTVNRFWREFSPVWRC